MKLVKLMLATLLTLAVAAAPAVAANGKQPVDRGPDAANGNSKSANAGPKSERTKGDRASSKARRLGKLCQGESKKRVEGEKGTPFSRCVTALAKIARERTDSPRVACKGMSKKHVKGEKGTEFSRCVVAAAKLRREMRREEARERRAQARERSVSSS